MAALLSLDNKSVTRANINEKEKESINKRYKKKISTLPKEKGWCTENMYLYQGFWYQPTYGLEGVMFAQERFEARPTDILLLTTQKSGTTWLKALTFAIANRTRYSIAAHPLLTANPHQFVAPLEYGFFISTDPLAKIESMPSPRILGTHIPYASLPESIFRSGCRIVYICRNPKDVLVSQWHFVNKLRDNDKELPPLSLQEAFDMFSQGVSPFGPYWDHVLGCWKANLEWPERVLFLKYEDMRRDTVILLKRLAEFLGQPFSIEEEEKGLVEEIIELCSFEKMSSLEVNKTGFLVPNVLMNNVFFREGKVGDYENHLTAEMIQCLNQITEEKFRGFDLSF